jgi:hypothetical protein
MKIKCPQCYKELDNYKKGDLLGHFYDEHDPNGNVLTTLFAFHIEKIHEILKDTDGWVEDECQNLVIERLKSLLEDKK